MLESYREEIIRKKRASRIFWLAVFLFAGFLYFFFQGYYPDIQFRLSSMGSGSVSGEERGLTIRSFGIVNVKVLPENIGLLLNDTPYGNNEKKMVDYGDYTIIVSGEGYLQNTAHFTIDREKPYYIDAFRMIRRPIYSIYHKPIDQIAKIGTNAWMIQNGSGMFLFEKGFSTGTITSKGKIAHIGEGHFLSGNTIVSYDLASQSWISGKNEGWNSFIKKCPSATVKNDILFCSKTKEGVSSLGKTLTGIIDIRSSYIQSEKSLITYENGRQKKIISLSGGVFGSVSEFIPIDEQWYFARSGSLMPVSGTGKRIFTPLESIRHMEWVEGTLLIFGSKGKDTFLSFFDTNNPEKTRTIPFPDISLRAIRIWETDGNFFIKTEGALLLIYRGSDEILWIIDGEILTVGDDIALYRKDGKLWEANWKEITQ